MHPSELPSISSLLDHRPEVAELVARFGRPAVTEALRDAVTAARDDVLAGRSVTTEQIVTSAATALQRWQRHRTRAVVNATGVVLHTNLGRAPLSAAAVAAAVDAAGATNLEYDLDAGLRTRRGQLVGEALAALCDAEAATVVNNGAAGVVLTLAALAGGGSVVVSRGELVEIGGSFRLPDIIAASGVRLVEVGTTNRTRVADYDAAVDHDTRAFLRVHPSNYRMVGFTQRPTVRDLAAVASRHGIPLVHDLGSGLLADDPVLVGEPSARRSLAEGADLVVFSGDKLFGGPQAGIVAGRGDLVERCRAHPLARALRVDKLRLAALEATVAAYRHGAHGDLPVWRALRSPVDQLHLRAEAIARSVGGEVVTTEAAVGGGAAPELPIESVGVALPGHGPEVLAALRAGDPPVIGRLHGDERALLDLRTVAPEQDETVVAAVTAALAREAPR